MNFSQKNLPKNLDWSDWHRDREEIIQQQLEEREAVVSRRNRSHFNYSFIGTISDICRLECKLSLVIFVELVVVLSLTYSRSFYGVSDVHASFIIVNWASCRKFCAILGLFLDHNGKCDVFRVIICSSCFRVLCLCFIHCRSRFHEGTR